MSCKLDTRQLPIVRVLKKASFGQDMPFLPVLGIEHMPLNSLLLNPVGAEYKAKNVGFTQHTNCPVAT